MIETTSELVLIDGEVRLGVAQQSALLRAPFRLSRVATLEEALAVLDARHPDVVLVGVRGSLLAVKTLAQYITQAGLSTQIVVLAQRPTVRGATATLQLGAADYLGLSTNPTRLVTAVRRVVMASSGRHVAQYGVNMPQVGASHRNDPAQQEALRDKDDLISLVSHELRTPLMAVNGYLEILQKYHEKLSREKTQEFIGRSLQATSELAYLSDMLVQVLQFEAGRIAPRFSAVTVAPLVHVAIEQCDLQVADHTIVSDVDADIVVRADIMALQQIVRNLISNAIKYSPQGGTITVSAQRVAGDMVELTVRDEGIGIAPEQMPLLFQRFARVHDAGRWPTIRGTGLGLYICRQLVTAHGGHIWATSTPGQGSTFHVRLPLAHSDDRTLANGNVVWRDSNNLTI